jgi:hypothetical protein
MLNQTDDRSIETKSGWCVGEPPMRWDVSVGARLAEKVKQLFWRDGGDRPVPMNVVGPLSGPVVGETVGVRKAA